MTSTGSNPEAVPEEGTDAFYAQCHKQFGLPPFAETDICIFGYGSILWKQNFAYTSEHEVYIKDYKRVFFQGSTDHRGSEEHPGRVVTLLPCCAFPAYGEKDSDPEYLKSHSSLVREEGFDGSKYERRVYGKAYQLPDDPQQKYNILRALDMRETGGYDCVLTKLYNAHPKNEDVEEPFDSLEDSVNPKRRRVCLCYMATEKAACFLGDAPLHDMAEQIVDAVGFSGSNKEYLFLLEEKLKEMGAHDPHVFALAEEARRILAEREGSTERQ